MAVAFHVGRGSEQRLDLLQSGLLAIGEGAAGEDDTLAALTGFGVAEVDEPILREAGVQHDVHEAALSLARDGRNAVDAFALLSVGGDEIERAGLLGNQHPAVRQERHRPGRFEVGDHLHLKRQVRRLLGRVGVLGRRVHSTAGNQ